MASIIRRKKLDESVSPSPAPFPSSSTSMAAANPNASASSVSFALASAHPHDVDVAWCLQYIAPQGFLPQQGTNGPPHPLSGLVPPASTSLLDRFLFQQDEAFAQSLADRDVATERKRMSEWKASRKVQVEPKRGCYKDATWRWLLIKSYVLERDFITGYVPRRVDTQSKKWHVVTKKRGVPPGIPPPIPLPDASLEEALDDLVEYKAELAEYLATEWEPPQERVSREKLSRQAVSTQRRRTILGSLTSHLPNLVNSDVDVLRSSLHGSHVALDTRAPKQQKQQQQQQQQSLSDGLDQQASPQLQSAASFRASPSLARIKSVGNLASASSASLADLRASPPPSLANQQQHRKKVEVARKQRPMLDDEVRREIEFVAEHLNEQSHLEEDEREGLHGREKLARVKEYGMRVREGLYVPAPVVPFRLHPSQRRVAEQEAMYKNWKLTRRKGGKVAEGTTGDAGRASSSSNDRSRSSSPSNSGRSVSPSSTAARGRSPSKGPRFRGSLVLDYSFMNLEGLHEFVRDSPRNKAALSAAVAAAAGFDVSPLRQHRGNNKTRNNKHNPAAATEAQQQQQPRSSLDEEALHQFRDKTLIFNATDYNTIVARGETYLFPSGSSQARAKSNLKEVFADVNSDDGKSSSQDALDEHTHALRVQYAPILNHPVLRTIFSLPGSEQQQQQPSRTRYPCEVLRLNDNAITNPYPEDAAASAAKMPDLFQFLAFTLSQRIADLSMLVSIDLSGNALRVFPAQVAELPSLRALYLHGNAIVSFNSVFLAVGLKPEHVVYADITGENFVGLVREKDLPPSQRCMSAAKKASAASAIAKKNVRVGTSLRQFKHVDRSEFEPTYSVASMKPLQLRLAELTLHGNPLNKTHPNVYKRNCLFAFPFLAKLDFTDVLEDDREEAFSAKQYRQLAKIREHHFPSASASDDKAHVSTTSATLLDASDIPFVVEQQQRRPASSASRTTPKKLKPAARPKSSLK